jgi:hypothetical protein
MPPLVSASRQRNGADGTVSGSQPPPSSLIAAHLAPTNGSTFPQFENQDFALLLEESLGSDEDGLPNLGTDVALNHKLICVIVKAGLDTIGLGSDDPFRKRDGDQTHIQKCLEVIHLVVDKTPEALFVLSESEELRPHAENVPLFVWLIPRLLSLLVLDAGNSMSIADSIWPLIGRVVFSEKRCLNNFDRCNSISSYIEELAEGATTQCYLREGLTPSFRATSSLRADRHTRMAFKQFFPHLSARSVRHFRKELG